MATFLRSYFPTKPTLLEKDVSILEGKVGLAARLPLMLLVLTYFFVRFLLSLEALEV